MSIEVKVPQAGESVTEADLVSWYVEDGAVVEEGEILCELETDKASMELPADTGGQVKILVEEGETVEVGKVIATIDSSASASSTETKPKPAETVQAPAPTQAQPQAQENLKNYPSPAADKIMREKGIDAASVQGSGKDGRIIKADVLNGHAHSSAAQSSSAQSSTPAQSAPVKSESVKTETNTQIIVPGFQSREVVTQKMSRLRKTIAKKLTEAKNSTAMLTTFNEVDMLPCMNLRKKYQHEFVGTHGIKLGFMSLFTKAACLALRKYPLVNAQIEQDNLLIPQYVDMGIAVSTEKGLVVPVLRNAESMSLAGIEHSIKILAGKAREGKLSMDEMSHGTFTITNGGIFGSMLSTPIINIPQSAILGMHNIVERPWVVNGEVKVRPIMYVALSYDHRIIDGKDSVGFLKTVKEFLEDPSKMLLDL